MGDNTLLIAGAGSGKTTYLVEKALSINMGNVLITTYTEANADEIKKKIISQIGYIPSNIIVQTWFSFLLQHGVRPYQNIMHSDLNTKKIGFFLAESSTTNVVLNGHFYSYSKVRDFYKYYFIGERNIKICSDTIADFVYSCNEKTKGAIIDRISRIYKYIFIDEIQDIAGWDLEIIKLLLMSNSNIILAGDPRQVTYLTHNPKKYIKYKDGKIEDFIRLECKKIPCNIDKTTLQNSHRNNQDICTFANKLFPSETHCNSCKCCDQVKKIDGIGVFLVDPDDIGEYVLKYKPTILREKCALYPEWNYGKSKGLTFDRVLIYPTKNIEKWIYDQNVNLASQTRCKFYVAVTRAKYSVGIVYSKKNKKPIDESIVWYK